MGFVVGESKPTFITALTSRALSVGEYIKISSDEGEILGLVEKSSVSSVAFTDEIKWSFKKTWTFIKNKKDLIKFARFCKKLQFMEKKYGGQINNYGTDIDEISIKYF